MTFGIVDQGFNKKSGALVRSEYTDAYKSVYGEDIQTVDGPIAQEIGVFSEREALIWNLLEAVYLAFTRDGASGASLDNVNSLIGVGRLEAQRSTVTLTLATLGNTPVNVAEDSQANQPSTGTLWETLSDSIIPAAVDSITDLVCIDIAYQPLDETVRYTFEPESLVDFFPGDLLAITGAGISSNNGLFPITAVNDGSNYVDVTNPSRTDATGDETGITATGSITDGFIQVSAQALETGPNAASINAITSINTPVLGWDFVSNLSQAIIGRDRESDTDFRRRAALSTVSSDGGTLSALKARIESEVDGVTAVFARENRTSAVDANGLPPHSIEITVVGGLDADIAALIYDAKPAGINTFGSISQFITNDFGDAEAIFFSRVTEIDIFFDVTLTVDGDYPVDGADQVRAALVSYGQDLANGDDVINVAAISAIVSSVPGILTAIVLQGTSDPPGVSANISIANTEVARITTGNIDVTS